MQRCNTAFYDGLVLYNCIALFNSAVLPLQEHGMALDNGMVLFYSAAIYYVVVLLNSTALNTSMVLDNSAVIIKQFQTKIN